jgi:hypothetical protein
VVVERVLQFESMRANLFFLFQHKQELYIVDNAHVQDVPKPRELIRRVSTVEQCRQIAESMNMVIASDTARERTKIHTPEGIERIRQAKMGDNHPARKHGRSKEFRDKVSKTMKGTRRGENNPMYNRRHSVKTRETMSELFHAREKTKWVCGPDNQRTRIPVSKPIPEGWQPGVYYDPYKPDVLLPIDD